jgi:hypothetical protein
MLHEFLTSNRSNLIARCRAKVALRTPGAAPRELQHGITPFLDQLIRTMRLEQKDDDSGSLAMSGRASGEPGHSEIGETAHKHGRELLDHGYSIDDGQMLERSLASLAVLIDAALAEVRAGQLSPLAKNCLPAPQT